MDIDCSEKKAATGKGYADAKAAEDAGLAVFTVSANRVYDLHPVQRIPMKGLSVAGRASVMIHHG